MKIYTNTCLKLVLPIHIFHYVQLFTTYLIILLDNNRTFLQTVLLRVVGTFATSLMSFAISLVTFAIWSDMFAISLVTLSIWSDTFAI